MKTIKLTTEESAEITEKYLKLEKEDIEEIKRRNDIVDVISNYVKLQKRIVTKKGSYYLGICPFHNEKSPSFSVNCFRQEYYCFGCGTRGNVITFIMNYENLTYSDAVHFLAQRAGIELVEDE